MNLRCKCNRNFREHSMDVVFRFIKEDYKNTESTWTYDTCTTDDGQTDAYGDVLFLGFDKTSKVCSLFTSSNINCLSGYFIILFKVRQSISQNRNGTHARIALFQVFVESRTSQTAHIDHGRYETLHET